MIKMDHQKTMNKKNGDSVVDAKASTSIEQVLGERGLLESIRAVFRDRARDYIARHMVLTSEGKIKIGMIQNEFRDAIDGLEVSSVKILKERVVLVNNIVIVRIANIEHVIEKYGENVEGLGLKMKKMANGTYRIVGLGRDNNISIEI